MIFFFSEFLLDLVYIRSCLIAFIVLIKPCTTDLYFLIICIPISTYRFQNHGDTFFIS